MNDKQKKDIIEISFEEWLENELTRRYEEVYNELTEEQRLNIETVRANKDKITMIKVRVNTNDIVKTYGGVTPYGSPSPLSEWTIDGILRDAVNEEVTIVEYTTF